MIIVSTIRKVKIKGRNLKYQHYSYFCDYSKEHFTDTRMDEINLENAYEALRVRKHNEKIAAIVGTCLLIFTLAWELMRCSTNWI
jgi:hypothetical protein